MLPIRWFAYAILARNVDFYRQGTSPCPTGLHNILVKDALVQI
jgi:hypothetical protein